MLDMVSDTDVNSCAQDRDDDQDQEQARKEIGAYPAHAAQQWARHERNRGRTEVLAIAATAVANSGMGAIHLVNPDTGDRVIFSK